MKKYAGIFLLIFFDFDTFKERNNLSDPQIQEK